MKLLTFIFSHDEIFRAVKLESSLLAERLTAQDGNPLFSEMVFDEEYLILFRQLFADAQGMVIDMIPSTYLRDIPEENVYADESDFNTDRDFILSLSMPDSFMMHYVKAITNKLREYITAYILFRWLENKNPHAAAIYAGRADAKERQIKSNLERRRHFLKIKPRGI